MNQSLVTFGRAVVLLLLAWKIESWLVPLLALFGMEESQIQNSAAIVQWVLYAGAVLLLLVNWWRSRQLDSGVAPTPEELEGYEGLPDDDMTHSSADDEYPEQTDQDEVLIAQPHGLIDQGHEVDEQAVATGLTSQFVDIPKPPPDFTGRKTEILDLLKRMGPGKANMLCLQSAEAGVGKSALALKLATRLQFTYPDGQIFLDMQGTSEQPLSPTDAMAYVVRKLHLTTTLPKDERTLRGAYYSLLKEKRILLLLDDVAGKEQIEPLIPPAGSGLLMTSRHFFSLPDLYAKRLSALSPDDARALLLKIAPRIGDHAGELATLCGLLPLALRLSASTLANREDILPEEYVWQLRDPQTPISRLSGVEKILHLSYNLLEETEQALWHLLAIFPSSFDRAAAAAVWQQDLNTTDKRLQALAALSLLEASPPLPKSKSATPVTSTSAHQQEKEAVSDPVAAPQMVKEIAPGEEESAQVAVAPPESASEEQDVPIVSWHDEQTATEEHRIAQTRRYRLHKEATLFANARLTDEERLAAERRHAKHFEGVLRQANKLYQQAESEAEAQSLFDKEWPNIQAGQAWAVKFMNVEDDKADKVAIALASSYPEAGGNLLQQQIQPKEHIRWLEAALVASRHLEQPIGESTYLGYLGQAYAKLGEPERALELYERLLKITRELGERYDEGNTLGHMARAYIQLGKIRPAITCYEQQLMVIRDLNDQHAASEVLDQLGAVYTEVGQMENAIACYQKQLASSRKIGNLHREGDALGNLGHVYSKLGQVHRALNYYERQLEILYNLRDEQQQGPVFGKLGNLYADSGDLSHAITCYKEQLAIARQLGNRQEEGSALGNLGITYAELGEIRLATRYCEQALQIDRELGDRENEAIGAWNLGLIYEQLGQLERAIQLLQITVEYERSIGDPNAEAHAQHLETVRKQLEFG